LILKIEEIDLSLEIEDKLLGKLLEEGKKHYPNEFGGFLIGYYSNNNRHLKITDSILPAKYRYSRSNFERVAEGIEEQLYKIYSENPSKFYIGEWHTHPNNSAIPSPTDISSICTIANMLDSCLKNPILLIIGDIQNQVEFCFYVLFNNKLYKYE
jgi:[CysO sulfur-carrier protein]-S-L-cysteine hydrolase